MSGMFRNERQFMNAVMSNARQLGYLAHHNEIAQGSESGFPDIVICGHGILRVIETKGPRWRIDPKQQRWIDELVYADQHARFAWPDDFDEIMRDLEEAYGRDHERRSQAR